ncbi:hypothetical protein [Pontiella agarivorans]|uniref:histidine kinase n=1 Tax=Pontiella agarivorans TaxID=3038953 RepID=A0ABU5N0C9_9BACT|nr:hypothetical protein [Pontiella agarivorans]MDZ8119902.1 hypothetical protein [Pontiella agarivorans]
MPSESKFPGHQFQPIKDETLVNALNELSRSINIATTYGRQHPAVEAAVVTAEVAMNSLFTDRKKVLLGSFNGMLTIDETPVRAVSTLHKSLEKRLCRLNITALKISQGITRNELIDLIQLLSSREAGDFQAGLNRANLSHITSDQARYKAVHDNEAVALKTDIGNAAAGEAYDLERDGTFVLDEETERSSSDIHVDQIIAFLKGNSGPDTEQHVGEGLSELASDPAKLGKIILESVALRQKVTDLSGESLSDIILGSLRRTYEGLRTQSPFKDKNGKADLQKAMLLLEKNLLDKISALKGESNPALDRDIIQAIRNMNEELSFEMAAMQYMEHRRAVEQQKHELQDFIHSRGTAAAEGLLADTNFPSAEWRRIVVESGQAHPQIADGLNTLATVFERLEKMMRSKSTDGTTVKDLLGQANENLDDTIFTTKEKLDLLSRQLKDGEAGTIGGHGRHMSQDELLAALSEVAQELMQPLTAITASLEMMLGGFVGEITHDQRDLIDLAANSGDHLKFLMKELIDIVGCPTNTGVDQRFHTTSEEVVQLRDAEGQEDLPLSYFQ